MNSSDGSWCGGYTRYFTSNHVLTAVAVVMATTSVYTLLANGTVLVAMIHTVYRDGQLSRQSNASHSNNSYITKLLMLSMTFCGVLVGGFLMPIALVEVITNGRWTLGQALYKVRVYSDYLLCGISSLHLAFMAIDTYLVICKPLLYRLLTAKTGYVMIAVGWSIPGLFILLWRVFQKDIFTICYNIFLNMSDTLIFNTCFGSFFLMVNLSLWFLYLLVLIEIKRFSQSMFKIKIQIKEDNDIPLVSTSSVAGDETKLNSGVLPNRKLKRNVKCFRFIGSILLSFTVFWIPPYVLLFLASLNVMTAPQWLLVVVIWLIYISSTVNPHLYCTNTSVRLAVKRLLFK